MKGLHGARRHRNGSQYRKLGLCGQPFVATAHCPQRPSLLNYTRVFTKQVGLGTAIVGANLRSPSLPYKVTFVATYHCNFRCEMCNIWQKKSVDEMTPAEVEQFFGRYPQFRWVHLTGGELFMRRDLDDVVAAIQGSCRSLFLLNFPTTGLVRRQDRRSWSRRTLEARRRTADGDHQHGRPEGAARRDARPAGQLGQGDRDVSAGCAASSVRTSRP